MRISDWSSDVCSSDLHWRWNGLWRRWPLPERAVRPDCVVMSPPSLDQDPGLGERVEDLAIEQFIAQRPVEVLAVTSEERGVGEEWVSTGRSRMSTAHLKKKNTYRCTNNIKKHTTSTAKEKYKILRG